MPNEGVMYLPVWLVTRTQTTSLKEISFGGFGIMKKYIKPELIFSPLLISERLAAACSREHCVDIEIDGPAAQIAPNVPNMITVFGNEYPVIECKVTIVDSHSGN